VRIETFYVADAKNSDFDALARILDQGDPPNAACKPMREIASAHPPVGLLELDNSGWRKIVP
jgi:hypothetical protein